ncbi:MAG: hypothetical protein NTW29_16305 [Bacteroidetes bacterium]|nr:hypothetical protein [Bacteroidota bacterium]
MKKIGMIILAAAFIWAGCKQKKAANVKTYISVRSIIEKQLAHIDTSLYSIIRVTGTDSLHMDTVYVKREEVRQLATDFLNVTDLSDPENSVRYKEETAYDTMLRRVIFTYTPINPEKEEVQKEQFLISLDIDKDGHNKYKSIILEKSRKDRNGAIHQYMLWRIDKSFLVTTTTQKPGQPEETTVTRVIWNEEN